MDFGFCVGDGVKRREEGDGGVDEEKNGGEEVSAEKVSENGFPCIDRLREELSCAVRSSSFRVLVLMMMIMFRKLLIFYFCCF